MSYTQQPPATQYTDSSRASLNDVTSGEALFQQAVTERNFLRSQNDQLWKIIEKQNIVIQGMREDIQKLINERDRLYQKLKGDSYGQPAPGEETRQIARKESNDYKQMDKGPGFINGLAAPNYPDNNSISPSSSIPARQALDNEGHVDHEIQSTPPLEELENQAKESFEKVARKIKDGSASDVNSELLQRQDSTTSVSTIATSMTSISVSSLYNLYDRHDQPMFHENAETTQESLVDSGYPLVNKDGLTPKQRPASVVATIPSKLAKESDDNLSIIPQIAIAAELDGSIDRTFTKTRSRDSSQPSELTHAILTADYSSKRVSTDSQSIIHPPSHTSPTPEESTTPDHISSQLHAVKPSSLTAVPKVNKRESKDQTVLRSQSKQSGHHSKTPSSVQQDVEEELAQPTRTRARGDGHVPNTLREDAAFREGYNTQLNKTDDDKPSTLQSPPVNSTNSSNIPTTPNTPSVQNAVPVQNISSAQTTSAAKNTQNVKNIPTGKVTGNYGHTRTGSGLPHVNSVPELSSQSNPTQKTPKHYKSFDNGAISRQRNRASVAPTRLQDQVAKLSEQNFAAQQSLDLASSEKINNVAMPDNEGRGEFESTVSGIIAAAQQSSQMQHLQMLYQSPGGSSSTTSLATSTTTATTTTNTTAMLLDNLNGIAVKVIGSNIKINEKGKEVLTFIISVCRQKVAEDGNLVGVEELWRVAKLYSDFLALDAKLKRQKNRNKIAKLPDKNLFTNHAPSKVDFRKVALEHYLQQAILERKDYKDLCEFLSTNVVEQNEKYYVPGHKKGYLTKRGKSFGGWKTRYFVLNSPVLEYYESEDGNHLGSIRLNGAQIGRQQANVGIDPEGFGDEDAFRHAFLILEAKPGMKGNVRHVLCAENDAERDEWVEALLQYVGEEDVRDRRSSKKLDAKKKPIIAKVDAKPIAQLEKDEVDQKLIISDIAIRQTREEAQSEMPRNESPIVVETQSSASSTPSSSLTQQSILSTSPPTQSILSSLYSSSNQSLQDFQSGTSGQSSSYLPSFRDSVPPPRRNEEGEKKDRSRVRMTFFGKSMFGNPKKEVDTSKTVFGVPLDQAIAVARIKEGYELPAVVYRCIEFLDVHNAALEEGIYRLNGLNSLIKALKAKFNAEGDVDLLKEGGSYDVHVVAGLLKLYLRELPTSVLTKDLHHEFVNVIDLLDRRDRVNELGRLVSALPLSNYTLLRTLIGHLIRVVQHSHTNKMTLRNIGIVFSPTLGIPAGVFNLFMAEYDYIFFTDAEGCAAPRSISPDLQDAQQLPPQQPQSETSLSSNSSPDGGLKPRSLSPSNMENSSLRANYLREEASGRTNRNSVQYMECLPNALAGLERKLTITRHESDDEEVNDLALQADDDEEEDHSADEGEQSIAGNLSPTPPSASAPQSPQSFNPTVPTSPRDESFATIESGDSLDGKGRQEHTGQRLSKDDLDAMTKTKRTTVRNFSSLDSVLSAFTDKNVDGVKGGVDVSVVQKEE